jgi:hypothetical protein
VWLVETVENRGKEIFSAARRKGVQRGKAHKVYGLRRAVSCGRDKASDSWTIRITDRIDLTENDGGAQGKVIEAKVTTSNQNIVAVADPQTAELALFAADIPPQDDASKLKPKPNRD